MDKEYFFDIDELHKIFKESELFVSLDVLDLDEGCNTNIFENKSVKLKNFPNTLEDMGKKFWCERKIKKYLSGKGNYSYTYKIKLEKNGIFEYSITLKINE